MQGPRAVLSDRAKTAELGSETRQVGKGTHVQQLVKYGSI